MSQDTGVSFEQSEHSSSYSEGSGHSIIPQDSHNSYLRSSRQDAALYNDSYPADRTGGKPGLQHQRVQQAVESLASSETSDPLSNAAPTHRTSLLLNPNSSLPRSVSMEDTSRKSPDDFPEVLKSSFEPDVPVRYHLQGYSSARGYYHPHQGSPIGSSSETGSFTSSVQRRLESGPASEVSAVSQSTQSTHSSSSSRSGHRVPRARHMLSPSPFGSNHSMPMHDPHGAYDSHPHHGQHGSNGWGGNVHVSRRDMFRSRSAVPGLAWNHALPSHREYPHLEEEGDDDHFEQLHHAPVLHRTRSKSCEAQDKHHSKDMKQTPEGLDTIFLLLSLITSKAQPDEQKIDVLEKLASSEGTCLGMRQSGCISLLLDIIHNWERKEEEQHAKVRQRAQAVLRKLVDTATNAHQHKYERNVLHYLEYIRGHTDSLYELLGFLRSGHEIDEESLEECRKQCEERVEYTVRKLNAKSCDKQDYRPVLLSLGGLQAAAEILVVDFKLARHYTSSGSGETVISHPPVVLSLALNILVNLTYGDAESKSALCQIPQFLAALVHHIRHGNEAVVASAAQILRNLSWRASNAVKTAIGDSEVAVALCRALERVQKESTLQHVSSALWNLSAHSLDLRERMCLSPTTIPVLVKLLSYDSSSATGSLIVVENVGGILRNLSAIISHKEVFRRKLRESKCVQKLNVQLKMESSRMVLENACGILWNLSTHCPEDQEAMWQIGIAQQLLKLKDSEHKNVADYAGKALRNLMQYRQGKTGESASKSDVVVRREGGIQMKQTLSHVGTSDNPKATTGGKAIVPILRTKSLFTEVSQHQQNQRQHGHAKGKSVTLVECERPSPDGHNGSKWEGSDSSSEKKERVRHGLPHSRSWQRIASSPSQVTDTAGSSKHNGGSKVAASPSTAHSNGTMKEDPFGDEYDDIVSTAGEEEAPQCPETADLQDSDDEGEKQDHFYMNLPPAAKGRGQGSALSAQKTRTPGGKAPKEEEGQCSSRTTCSDATSNDSPSRSTSKEQSKKRRFLPFGRSRSREKITDL